MCQESAVEDDVQLDIPPHEIHEHSHNPLTHPVIQRYRIPALIAVLIFLTLVVTA
jgi:hypothetical protein